MSSPQASFPSSQPPVSQFSLPSPRSLVSTPQHGPHQDDSSVLAHLGFTANTPRAADGVIHAPPSQQQVELRNGTSVGDVARNAQLTCLNVAIQDLEDSHYSFHLSSQRKPTEEALVESITLTFEHSKSSTSVLPSSVDLWEQFQVSFSWRDDHSTNYMRFHAGRDMLEHIANHKSLPQLPNPLALSDDWRLMARMNDPEVGSRIEILDTGKSEIVSRIPVDGAVKTINFARQAVMVIACGELDLNERPVNFIIFNTTTGTPLKSFTPVVRGAEGPMYELMGTFSADNKRVYSIMVNPKGEHRAIVRRLDDGMAIFPIEEFTQPDTSIEERDAEDVGCGCFASRPNALFSELLRCALRRRSDGPVRPSRSNGLCSCSQASRIKRCFQDVMEYPHNQVLGARDCLDHRNVRAGPVWRGTLVLRDGTVLHVHDGKHWCYSLLDPYLYLPASKKSSFTHVSSRAQRVWPTKSILDVQGRKGFVGPKDDIASDGILNSGTSSMCQHGRTFACVYNPLAKEGLRSHDVVCLSSDLLADDHRGDNSMDGAVLMIQETGALAAEGVEHANNALLLPVVVAPPKRSIVVWDLWHGDICHCFQHPREVVSVQVSQDGKLLTASISGEVAKCRVDESYIIVSSLISFQQLYRCALFADAFSARIVDLPPNHHHQAAAKHPMQLSFSFSPQNEAPRWAVRMAEDGPVPMQLPAEQAGEKRKYLCISDNLEVFCFVSEYHGRDELVVVSVAGRETAGKRGERKARVERVQVTDFLTEPRAGAREGNEMGRTASSASLQVGRTASSQGGAAMGLGRASSSLGGASAMRAMAISGSGDTVAMCFKKGNRRFLNLLGTEALLQGKTQPGQLIEIGIPFSPGSQVKAMCVSSMAVSIAADHFSAEGVECSICQIDLLTGHADPKMDSFKIAGETIGLAAHGQIRLARDQDRTILLQSLEKEETLYRFSPPKLDLMGISADGSLIVFPDPAKSSRVIFKDLNIIDTFGPSDETFQFWAGQSGPDAVLHGVDKETLQKWILLRRSHWAQQVSRVLDRGLEGRDYSSIEMLLAACPILWAAMLYTPSAQEKGSRGRRSSVDLVIEEAGAVSGKAGFNMLELALTANDKHLMEILLQAVVDCVKDTPEKVPVSHMEQVTALVTRSLRERKMMEKVDQFLKDLPLIKIILPDEEVLADFPDGEVLTTSWWAHHEMTSASPWTWVKNEQGFKGAARGEKGHRYVVPLPGLAEPETLTEFTASGVDPSLFDNECMKVTIDSLELTMQVNLPYLSKRGHQRYSVDLQLMLYVSMLTAYCLFVVLASTKDTEVAELAKSRNGMVGIVLGAYAALVNGYVLVLEILEFLSKESKISWLLVPWNILPLVGNTSSIVSFLLVVTFRDSSDGWDRHATRAWASVGMVMLWLDLFNYLRAYHKGTALVELLVEIMIDMVYFVGVTAVLIFAFAFGFFALHGNLDPEQLYGEADGWTETQAAYAASGFQFSKLEQCVARTFTFAVLGSFDMDNYRSPVDMDDQGILTLLSSLFFVMAAFLITIVALNALIAIMGNTYSRVAAQEKAVVYKEISAVMLDKIRLYVRDKDRFMRFLRWTHVLSPSETGSIAQRLGAKREEANVRRTLVSVAQDTKAIQRDLEGLRSQPEDFEKKIEEHLSAHGDQIKSMQLALSTMGQKLSGVPGDVGQLIDAEVSRQMQAIDAKLERMKASWDKQLQRILDKVSEEKPPARHPVTVKPLSSFPLVVVSPRAADAAGDSPAAGAVAPVQAPAGVPKDS